MTVLAACGGEDEAAPPDRTDPFEQTPLAYGVGRLGFRRLSGSGS